MLYPMRTPRRRSCDPGIVWPSNGGPTPTTVGDPFGHRTFSGHSSGIDLHRGIDVLVDEDGVGETAGTGGMPVYSPVNGCVIRRHYSWFQFDDAGNLDQLTEQDTNSKATFARSGSNLVITGKNTGTVTFPSGIARYEGNEPFSPDAASGDWIIVWALPSTFTATGKLVMGIYDSANDEYACLEYDGATFTVKGKDSGGVMTADGTTASASVKWARVRLDSASGTLYWERSNTGLQGSWTTIATEGTITWTRNWSAFRAFIGFDPAASGADDSISVDMFGYGDVLTITRFGNWVEIATASDKFCMLHFRHFSVDVGDVVRAGQQIGVTGKTGADALSGTILENHVHIEYIANSNYIYANADPINPLGTSILPRTNGSANVSGVLSSATYPGSGGGDSWKLAITVTRSDQDFDVNQIQLVGSSATRTLNYDTRSGLDPADHDAVEYDGVYFEPQAFTQASASYVINLYYKKATVGSGTPTWSVKDTAGTTLASG